ncbi:putative RDD family membrane protein YckC [Winogradskyella pacifica]|uniref:Putative RDD family membrane protein YckC n=1 Tax=Winogradskyella pacifica TaxID=664642 RepID=A0A3D9LHT6_9FLAO|nr:RDD family protein [Winogradskyella pacifica]REE06918.1 putative RDD family membrane protein YckC [Winogradskyella pacifica]
MTENNQNSNEMTAVGVIKKTVDGNYRLRRISSMLLDHFLMCILIIPPAIILTIISENIGLKMNDGMGFFVFFLIVFVYLNKDFFKGKSPAKRILGYKVINQKTEKPATELQCFVRNLTICVAWPLEVVVGFINPERRIGDFIANTKVVESEKEKLKSIWTDLKSTTLKLNFIGILIIGGIYFYGLSLILPNMN